MTMMMKKVLCFSYVISIDFLYEIFYVLPIIHAEFTESLLQLFCGDEPYYNTILEVLGLLSLCRSCMIKKKLVS